MLSLCFSIASNGGWKTVLGPPSSHVLLTQWLPLCLEPDFACAGKGAPLWSWSDSLAGSTVPGRPFQYSALTEELHLLACHRALYVSGGQGQGWLSLGIIWVICCILFRSWLGSRHCLLAQSHAFYIPSNPCTKDWFVISLKVCNTPLSRHLFSQLHSEIASTKTSNEIQWAFLKITTNTSHNPWLFVKYIVAKWVWYDNHANNTAQCYSRYGDRRAWGWYVGTGPWAPVRKQSRIYVSFPGF